MYASDTPSVTATSSSSTASTVASSPNSGTAASNDASVSKDVSVGVPIGVGVGIGLPLAILAVTFGILFGRERRRRVEAERDVAVAPRIEDVVMRHDEQTKDNQTYRQPLEFYDPPPFELSGRRDPAELPGRK